MKSRKARSCSVRSVEVETCVGVEVEDPAFATEEVVGRSGGGGCGASIGGQGETRKFQSTPRKAVIKSTIQSVWCRSVADLGYGCQTSL